MIRNRSSVFILSFCDSIILSLFYHGVLMQVFKTGFILFTSGISGETIPEFHFLFIKFTFSNIISYIGTTITKTTKIS